MKNRYLLYLSLLIMSLNTSLAQQLDELKWKNRVLILKSTNKNNELISRQLEAFENDKDGMVERKLVVYVIQGNDIRFIDFKSKQPKQMDKENIRKSGQKLFETKSESEVILIGLDGTVKLRQTDFLPLENLFTRIDGMPMRRAEIRGKN